MLEALADHEVKDDQRFGELIALVKPINEEIVGTKDSLGMRERLRTLEARDLNRKWVVGLLFGGTGVLLLDRAITWLSHKGPPIP